MRQLKGLRQKVSDMGFINEKKKVLTLDETAELLGAKKPQDIEPIQLDPIGMQVLAARVDQLLDSDIVYKGKFVQMLNRNGWEYVARIGSTAVVEIIAVTDDFCLLLTEQYRVPVGKRVIELPAGLVGDMDQKEEILKAANRELEEETGYRAGKIEIVGSGPSSPGLTSEIVSIALAKDLKKVSGGGGDKDEDIIVHKVKTWDVFEWSRQMVEKGFLVSPRVYVGLYFFSENEKEIQI
jgi:ADP-ribose pyrophosphatase